MRVILEVIAGPHAGEKILLRAGQAAQVGRTEWADFAYPRDGQMSGVHFAVECTGSACRLRDLGSSNGTLINGKEVVEAVLSDGDEVQAGQSRFCVRIEGLPPPAAAAMPIVPVARSSSVAPGIPIAAPTPAAPVPVQPRLAGAPTPGVGGQARPYAAALGDADPRVRREALLAAAWTRQPWLLSHCERLCDQPKAEDFDALWLLAVLGGSQHLPRMLSLGGATLLGPRRFEILGAYGHPGVVELLLKAIGSRDPRMAVAAGAAFSRITGAEIDSDETIALPSGPVSPPEQATSAADASPPTEEPEGAAETEASALEEVVLPSVGRARAFWREARPRMAGTRYSRGLDLSGPPTAEILAQLDRQSYWEASLRGKFDGWWPATPVDWEVYPQPTAAAIR